MKNIILVSTILMLSGCGKTIIDYGNTAQTKFVNSLSTTVTLDAYSSGKIGLSSNISPGDTFSLNDKEEGTRPGFFKYDSLKLQTSGKSKVDVNCFNLNSDSEKARCSSDTVNIFDFSDYAIISEGDHSSVYFYSISYADSLEMK
ncbi:hypothetical protein [Rurimicrobium arvi]